MPLFCTWKNRKVVAIEEKFTEEASTDNEEFTYDEAKYTADNCRANWKEQALLKDKLYLDIFNFS